RDKLVTGVQTCALPICTSTPAAARTYWRAFANVTLPLMVLPFEFDTTRIPASELWSAMLFVTADCVMPLVWIPNLVRPLLGVPRSEERRVGKECRSRWW